MSTKGKGKTTTKILNANVGVIPNILSVVESELKNMTDRDYTELYYFVKENFSKFKTDPTIWPPIGTEVQPVVVYDTKNMNDYKYLKSKKIIDETVKKYLKLYLSGVAFVDKIDAHLDLKTNFLKPISAFNFKDGEEAEIFKDTPGYDFFKLFGTKSANQRFVLWDQTPVETRDKKYLYLRELAKKLRPIHTAFKLSGNRTNTAVMKNEIKEILNFMETYEKFDTVQQIDSKIQLSSSSNEEEDIGPLVTAEFSSFEPIDFFPDRRIS